MIKYCFISIVCILAISCGPKMSEAAAQSQAYEDSISKAMHWKPLRDGLYISKFGDVGFKTTYHINESEVVETYKYTFVDKDATPFKKVIDTKTFHQIGGDWGWGGYFKDKNHVYHFFGNSDGGNLYIVDDADVATFEVVSNCYGRDKNHIYDMRFGAIDSIESKDFKILYHNERCWGKYRNDYYNGNKKLSSKELADPKVQKSIELLNKL